MNEMQIELDRLDNIERRLITQWQCAKRDYERCLKRKFFRQADNYAHDIVLLEMCLGYTPNIAWRKEGLGND